MNTELEHLKRMRKLLAKGWTQGALARDENGGKVHPLSHRATCYCVLGALDCVVSGDNPEFESLLRPIKQVLEKDNIMVGVSTWNDMPGRTQAEVMELADRAIEIKEAAE